MSTNPGFFDGASLILVPAAILLAIGFGLGAWLV